MSHNERLTVRIEPDVNPGLTTLDRAGQGEPYIVVDNRGHDLPNNGVVFKIYDSYLQFPGGYYGKSSTVGDAKVRPVAMNEKVVIECRAKGT